MKLEKSKPQAITRGFEILRRRWPNIYNDKSTEATGVELPQEGKGVEP